MGVTMKRGAFLVLEGCDRSGKSTQSRLLLDFLKAKGVLTKHMAFPARISNIGKVINSYLTNKQELPDECIHLLFSANRWEFHNEIRTLLESGTTLVVDRYSYSGIAYSVAKGLDYDWCKSPEKGLIRPDAVFYLKTSVDELTNRGDFGAERYEVREFQCKVSAVFNRIYDEESCYWHVLNAGLPKEDLSAEIHEKTLQLLLEVQNKPLMLLN